jgi:hypothetical protein
MIINNLINYKISPVSPVHNLYATLFSNMILNGLDDI